MKRMITAPDKLHCGRKVCATSILSAAVVVATAMALPAQTLTTLYNFGQFGHGVAPNSLILTTGGNYYGTTAYGGTAGCREGCGTIFKMTPAGSLTTLHLFCAQGTYPNACPDGFYPEAGLIQAANGDFYGTTPQGGANGLGGTIFKITPSGALTVLYSFCSPGAGVCPDGSIPQGVIQATDGDFYGITEGGGDYEAGTIFKITPSGKLTTLYNFCSKSSPPATCTDGEGPNGLIQASDGAFYGTTIAGGNYGRGTVFRFTPSDALTTLYSFCPHATAYVCPDGQNPDGRLFQAAGGELYGTTIYGGANGNYGTIFKITPRGALTTVYSFCSETNCTDGAFPGLWFLSSATGESYGTTASYGANGQGGTIFQFTPGGALTTLYSFCSQGAYPACKDGDGPAALVQAANGDLYGAAIAGGASRDCQFKPRCGTIFSLSADPGPAADPLPGNTPQRVP